MPVLVEEALQIVIPEMCRIGIIILTSAEKWDKENQKGSGMKSPFLNQKARVSQGSVPVMYVSHVNMKECDDDFR